MTWVVLYWTGLLVLAWAVGRFLIVGNGERASRLARRSVNGLPYLVTLILLVLYLGGGVRFRPPATAEEAGWAWAGLAYSTVAMPCLGLVVLALVVLQRFAVRRESVAGHGHGGIAVRMPLLYGSMLLYWVAFALLVLTAVLTRSR